MKRGEIFFCDDDDDDGFCVGLYEIMVSVVDGIL